MLREAIHLRVADALDSGPRCGRSVEGLDSHWGARYYPHTARPLELHPWNRLFALFHSGVSTHQARDDRSLLVGSMPALWPIVRALSSGRRFRLW